MTIRERLRKILRREPEAWEVAYYTSNFGKQRPKPADKMRRKHEDK